MANILQTSNIIWKSVSLTDELKINLEYNTNNGLLNIFVKNTNDNNQLPCNINVLSNQIDQCELILNSNDNNLLTSYDINQVISDNEPKIYYEISTTYVYDIIDENENENENFDQIDFSQTIIPSLLSSSSSSCFDEQTMDNDDGYSTHSLDDIEQLHLQQQQQQQSLAILSSKLIKPSMSFEHSSSSLSDYYYYYYYSEQYVSLIRRLIQQMTWSSPLKHIIRKMMMMNHMFN